MSCILVDVREGGYDLERNSVVLSCVKRNFAMINSDSIPYGINISRREARSEDGKTRKLKKFRAEWMEEEYLKDWLQPYPGNDTMCICTACDLVLRCGKSELEKHASGLKHTKRVEEMQGDPCHDDEDSQSQVQSNTQASRLEQLLCRNDNQVWIPVTSHAELAMDNEDDEEGSTENEAGGYIKLEQKEKPSCDVKLTEALIKLFEYADGKVDLSRKRLEMLQEEHALKLQILEKELRLKSLEVEIKETELRKLRLESMQIGVKESQVQPNTHLTISDQQLHVVSDQHLLEALQAQLQHFQNHHQSQESKGVNGT